MARASDDRKPKGATGSLEGIGNDAAESMLSELLVSDLGECNESSVCEERVRERRDLN